MKAQLWLQKAYIRRLAEGHRLDATSLTICSPDLRMEHYGYIKLHEIEIDDERLPTREQAIQLALDDLDASEKELRAKFEEALAKIRESREKMLALPNVTSTVPPEDIPF